MVIGPDSSIVPRPSLSKEVAATESRSFTTPLELSTTPASALLVPRAALNVAAPEPVKVKLRAVSLLSLSMLPANCSVPVEDSMWTASVNVIAVAKDKFPSRKKSLPRLFVPVPVCAKLF